MPTQYRCKNEKRRATVRDTRTQTGSFLNGIDYLEVSADRTLLTVSFIHPLPGQPDGVPQAPVLNEFNLMIVGGARLQQVGVRSISAADNHLSITLETPADLSQYTLRLVISPTELSPPPGFDPQLAQVDFRFRSEGRSEFDCQTPPEPTLPPEPTPRIDYLAKDYASFRQLMLDRLSVIMPQWSERSPADIGVMLVEVMAYVADRLSYTQDAVATEAYLGTARKRISIRRHARLLDYFMHDGCNARTWVAIEVSDGVAVKLRAAQFQAATAEQRKPQVQFVTRVDSLPLGELSVDDFRKAVMEAGAQVFEPLHDLTLYPQRNQLEFYTWGDEQCTLPTGSTRATLKDPQGQLLNKKYLAAGDVLIFEERQNPTNLHLEPNLSHRHAVRLTKVARSRDPLFNQPLIEVEWDIADALPFPLIISALIDGRPIDNISVVRGNVVLVDHGCTAFSVTFQNQIIFPERLPEADPHERYRPTLQRKPVTQQGYVLDRYSQWVTFNPEAPASQAFDWDMRDVRPAIVLQEQQDDQIFLWKPQYDLLNSDRFARQFVLETEEDNQAFLRFGDGELGRQPPVGNPLSTIYRFGNGRLGNVGAAAIAHVMVHDPKLEGRIQSVRNPLAAQGGLDPEAIEQVRLYAPQAFRVQQRAVTEADYARITERFPEVVKAVATKRWTGSGYTVFITVDRQSGKALDSDFRQRLQTFLERFRLVGHHLEISEPQFVPLEIAMIVNVASGYYRSAVTKALLETFSNGKLANGTLGFFHPDRLTFGQSVYLSQVIAQAMKVDGVRSVTVTRFQRGIPPIDHSLELGEIRLGRLEIARLDNDPSTPSNGRITFQMEGGL